MCFKANIDKQNLEEHNNPATVFVLEALALENNDAGSRVHAYCLDLAESSEPIQIRLVSSGTNLHDA